MGNPLPEIRNESRLKPKFLIQTAEHLRLLYKPYYEFIGIRVAPLILAIQKKSLARAYACKRFNFFGILFQEK
jgi:hypothetical protein